MRRATGPFQFFFYEVEIALRNYVKHSEKCKGPTVGRPFPDVFESWTDLVSIDVMFFVEHNISFNLYPVRKFFLLAVVLPDWFVIFETVRCNRCCCGKSRFVGNVVEDAVLWTHAHGLATVPSVHALQFETPGASDVQVLLRRHKHPVCFAQICYSADGEDSVSLATTMIFHMTLSVCDLAKLLFAAAPINDAS